MNTNPPPQRKIIHIDMDCFYAAVEMRDNPELLGKPIGVGGSPDGRGVLCTANYEARQYGVRSAMASATALRRCPDLVLLPVNMNKYREVSQRIQAIFADYTSLVEPLSLDEAFLDVTDVAERYGGATAIAKLVRQRIHADHQLTASAGISVNKFLAKIASDWNKPNGQYVIPPHAVDAFVEALPVGKLFGVGKVTEKKLHELGIQTCGDLRPLSETELQQHFGRFGGTLFRLCRGIDKRPVKPNRHRKSISVERTFADDLPDLNALTPALEKMLPELQQRFERHQQRYRIHALTVKLKFHDFEQTTASKSGQFGQWHSQLFAREFHALTLEAWQRRQKPCRLLGIGFQVAELESTRQQDLFATHNI